ncbi:MAG: type II secretion system F family protein [Planctomycetes bacterium]|nr:type II secretion system F family protein [Planctomycetota bacterium]
MAEYEYQAETRTGERVRGSITAVDETAAHRELALRGLTIIDLLWCPAVDEAGTLHDEELITLAHAVGTAAASRVPLELTLAVLAEEKNDPRLADVAHRFAARLQQGATIDQAVADLEDELPAEVRGLMRAGIETNDLAGTFQRFTHERLASQRVSRRIRAAIAYPLLVLAILVPIMLFLGLYVVPMFAEMYEEFDLALPALTELILQTAEQLPGLIVGLLVLVIAVPIALRILGGRWLLHRFRAAIPMLGRLWIWSGQREFAALLASFLELRMPLSRAVALTGDSMSDRNVARACRRVSERLESGESLSSSLNHSINFDRTLVAMAAWGESHGLLPQALQIATEVFDDRIEQHISLVRRLLPPFALVTVGAIMIFFILGLFIPLVQLINYLSM